MTNMPPSEKVTKLDAVRRQLAVAIRLHFERRDLIAIHTLVSAASGILLPIVKIKEPELYECSILNKDCSHIAPEERKEWSKWIRSGQNFFKHADNDPEEIYEFETNTTLYHLLEASRLYLLIDTPVCYEVTIFMIWYGKKHSDTAFGEKTLSKLEGDGLNRFPDPERYDLWLELLDNRN